ncbi:MAG TPA: DUF21 domain-containing protein, partial [Nitrospirales bacterium]|nr:DUF21 domain-containing protein [Nitrospirales bacterium]
MDYATLVILILLSAVISAAEIAFFSVNQHKLRALAEAGKRRAAVALHLRANPQRLLSTIMIADKTVDTGAAFLTTIITLRVFSQEWVSALSVGVLTLFLLIYGEIVPKTLAVKHSLTLTLLMAYPVYGVQKVLQPILFLLEPIIDKLTGGKGVTVPLVSE